MSKAISEQLGVIQATLETTQKHQATELKDIKKHLKGLNGSTQILALEVQKNSLNLSNHLKGHKVFSGKVIAVAAMLATITAALIGVLFK